MRAANPEPLVLVWPPSDQLPFAGAPAILPEGIDRVTVQAHLSEGRTLWEMGLAPRDHESPDPDWRPHYHPPIGPSAERLTTRNAVGESILRRTERVHPAPAPRRRPGLGVLCPTLPPRMRYPRAFLPLLLQPRTPLKSPVPPSATELAGPGESPSGGRGIAESDLTDGARRGSIQAGA